MSLDTTTTPVVSENGQTNGVFADELLETLERSAYAQDHHTFLDSIQDVDWSARPPEHIIHAVKMAVLVGAARLAMKLAQESAQLFPDDPRCQLTARLVAPAKIVGTKPGTGRDMRPNSEWLKAHAREYRMQWVALRDGKLLGASPSLKEVDEMIQDEEDLGNVLVTKVV